MLLIVYYRFDLFFYYCQILTLTNMCLPVDLVFWGNPLDQRPQRRVSLSSHHNLSAVYAEDYL